jgi:dTDP-glucose 4,6-dehydratase
MHWRRTNPKDKVVVLDALTYAGNRASLDASIRDGALTFVHGDICDAELVDELFGQHRFDVIVHFAAESHVDRSIISSTPFIRTNVQGTHTLLEAALAAWKGDSAGKRFHHISTDEVFGSLKPDDPPFVETTRYDPRSPYAASKAASDFLVRAYGHTFGLPTTVTNCSNNYGPYQFPEKLIPLMIVNALAGQRLPIYGDGLNIRDWLYVEDHCAAIELVLRKGSIGETYNVGGGQEKTNIALVGLLCDEIDRQFSADPALTGRFPDCPPARRSRCSELIGFVTDRPGHDRRYAMCANKLSKQLAFRARTSLPEGLSLTVAWYLANEQWWRSIQTGAYLDWIKLQYKS